MSLRCYGHDWNAHRCLVILLLLRQWHVGVVLRVHAGLERLWLLVHGWLDDGLNSWVVCELVSVVYAQVNLV